MKKAAVLFVGLICAVLFGLPARAGRFGDRIRPPADPPRTVVAREWKGRVAPARADEYHRYLLGGVAKLRSVPGSLGVQVMRRDEAGAVEFTVISYWGSREAIKTSPRTGSYCSNSRRACCTTTSPIPTWRRSESVSRVRRRERRGSTR
jgi:hypothetical protein